MIRCSPHLRAVLNDHESIFDAIKRQDSQAAKAAMARSIQVVIDQVIQNRTREERDQIARELTPEALNLAT